MFMLGAAPQELELFTILMRLVGGLAIFLFGMDLMTDALKVIAGTRMKDVLAKLTKNRISGVFAGAFVTSVIQSSSVTTVLVVGFITAGIMTLTQAIPIIMGANIGTTITNTLVSMGSITRKAEFKVTTHVERPFSCSHTYVYIPFCEIGLKLFPCLNYCDNVHKLASDMQ